MKHLPLILAALALLGVLVLISRVSALEARLKTFHAPRPGPERVVGTGEDDGGVEVAAYMGRIQEYAQKLWLAGNEGNKPLAHFYIEEMEECMETLEKAGIVDEGVPVSAHMRTYGLKEIDALEAQLKHDGFKDFAANYDALMNTCNTCHTACGRPYIHVQVPTGSRYSDQVFAPMR